MIIIIAGGLFLERPETFRDETFFSRRSSQVVVSKQPVLIRYDSYHKKISGVYHRARFCLKLGNLPWQKKV